MLQLWLDSPLGVSSPATTLEPRDSASPQQPFAMTFNAAFGGSEDLCNSPAISGTIGAHSEGALPQAAAFNAAFNASQTLRSSSPGFGIESRGGHALPRGAPAAFSDLQTLRSASPGFGIDSRGSGALPRGAPACETGAGTIELPYPSPYVNSSNSAVAAAAAARYGSALSPESTVSQLVSPGPHLHALDVDGMDQDIECASRPAGGSSVATPSPGPRLHALDMDCMGQAIECRAAGGSEVTTPSPGPRLNARGEIDVTYLGAGGSEVTTPSPAAREDGAASCDFAQRDSGTPSPSRDFDRFDCARATASGPRATASGFNGTTGAPRGTATNTTTTATNTTITAAAAGVNANAQQREPARETSHMHAVHTVHDVHGVDGMDGLHDVHAAVHGVHASDVHASDVHASEAPGGRGSDGDSSSEACSLANDGAIDWSPSAPWRTRAQCASAAAASTAHEPAQPAPAQPMPAQPVSAQRVQPDNEAMRTQHAQPVYAQRVQADNEATRTQHAQPAQPAQHVERAAEQQARAASRATGFAGGRYARESHATPSRLPLRGTATSQPTASSHRQEGSRVLAQSLHAAARQTPSRVPGAHPAPRQYPGSLENGRVHPGKSRVSGDRAPAEPAQLRTQVPALPLVDTAPSPMVPSPRLHGDDSQPTTDSMGVILSCVRPRVRLFGCCTLSVLVLTSCSEPRLRFTRLL